MMSLAPYAAHPEQSRGRQHPEESPQSRNQFQRDKDRIIHSSAFRRLEYKTQVFVNHEGDLFRNRLTHSLEVAQIGRAIARNLKLHEDLIEGIALAHDLGHTPFGHAGQDALNDCMKAHGGFEHNLQSLRVVDFLEQRYAEFDGLNLTFELREGILKHCSVKNAKMLGEVGERFIHKQQPSLEAQVTNLADEIAYNNHDVDDGLRSGLITLDQLAEVDIFAVHLQQVTQKYPQLTQKSQQRRLIHETIRRMINAQVIDLCQQSQRNIDEAAPQQIDDVRKQPMLIAFSGAMAKQQTQLKKFLRNNLYRHYRVNRMSAKARQIITGLFNAFIQDTSLMPEEYQDMAKQDYARAVADYIAGMTDRYAIREYQRIFTVSTDW